MNTYIYQLKLVERLWDKSKWTKNDEKVIEKHFLRIKKDVEQGKIYHVGKTFIEDENGFGIVIFYANNDVEATKYMNEDPAINEGLMIGNCMPYKIVF